MDSALGRSPAEILKRRNRRSSISGRGVGVGVGAGSCAESGKKNEARRRSDVTWMRRFIGELLVFTCARTRALSGPFPQMGRRVASRREIGPLGSVQG